MESHATSAIKSIRVSSTGLKVPVAAGERVGTWVYGPLGMFPPNYIMNDNDEGDFDKGVGVG